MAPQLTMMTTFQVGGDVRIHARPEEALQQTFFGFVDTVMSRKEFPVSFS
jgi:hypothetical protein